MRSQPIARRYEAEALLIAEQCRSGKPCGIKPKPEHLVALEDWYEKRLGKGIIYEESQ